MDKINYLSNTNTRLDELVEDENFINALAQVRSRAIHQELVPEQPYIGFTFDPKRMWAYCEYIFSEGALLLREEYGQKEAILSSIRTAAQGFEFLATFSEKSDQELLLINSAMCYHIAGYQASAQCLARRIKSDFLSAELSEPASPDEQLISLFRQALVQFLTRDIAKLQETTGRAMAIVQGLQQTIARGIAENKLSITTIFDLTAHAYFHQALNRVVAFCLDGNSDTLLQANGDLQKCYIYFQKGNDTTLSTITSELRTVLALLDERSTWSNIARHTENLATNPVWQLYLRNIAINKSVVEFWISQLKAIRAGLLSGTNSYVIQMPTSAGKTLIAELTILAALTTNPHSRCLYIAPYRALVNEIESSLSETLGSVGYRVSNLLGGFEMDSLQNYLVTESNVVVATPEKVELFYRAHPEYFANISAVVVDEGHILDEGIPAKSELIGSQRLQEHFAQEGTLGRGVLLELLVTRLRRNLPEARFVVLSAVMPKINASDFVKWLSEKQGGALEIISDERPSRQAIAKFEWRSSTNGELEYLNLPKLSDGRNPWVPFFVQQQQYRTGELNPSGRAKKKTWPDLKSKVQTTAVLASRFAKTGPVLVFCAAVKDVRGVAKNVVTTLKYLEASEQVTHKALRYAEKPDLESFQLALDWFGIGHPLTEALQYGVGIHYGPLPDQLRQAIEDEFRRGKLQILISTNTLAQGVNMPIKTAIIYSLERRPIIEDLDRGNVVHNIPVSKRDFLNICGRAGRAGKETEGQIVFVVVSKKDRQLQREYTESVLEEVESALYKLLEALVDRRIDQSELIGYLDAHLLALLAEEVVDTNDEDAVTKFLRESLVGIQALRNNIELEPLVQAFTNASTWVMNQVPDKALRSVFSTTGLRVTSCQKIMEVIDSSRDLILAELAKTPANALQASEVLLKIMFDACRDLPEMKLANSRRYFGPRDEFDLVKAWIRGSPISQLRTDYWDSSKEEDFSRYVADRMNFKLPWGANGFIRILSERLERDYETLPLSWQHLPSMLKYGVDHVVACWVCSLTATSRNLAQQLSSHYHPENNRPAYASFVSWITNLPTEFIVDDLVGRESEKRRLLAGLYSIVVDKNHLEILLNGELQFESAIQGIQYEDRQKAASQVAEGDQLLLELEPTNRFDPYAVKVLFMDKHIGYVQRDKSQLVAREMIQGRDILAYATHVKSAAEDDPFLRITMNISVRQP